MAPEPAVGGLPFVKLQGTGNDFVLIDGRWLPEQDWPALAQQACPRRFGIGADGLLVVLPSARASARMRMYNPDGSEDMCGNGLRCVVRYLHDREELPPEGALIEALSGLRAVRTEVSANGAVFSADMGGPLLGLGGRGPYAHLEAADEHLAVTLISMGTPHAVIVNHGPLPDARWLEVSAAVERHPSLPEHVTATWVEVAGRREVCARFYERAVGPTLACGTGACAALVACALRGLTERRVRVVMPGGVVDVEWEEGGGVRMTGPAERVYSGVFPQKESGRPPSYAR